MSLAKALTSAYLPISAALICRSAIYQAHGRREPQDRHVRPRLHLFRPSGWRCGGAEDARNLRARRDLRAMSRPRTPASRSALQTLRDHPLVGECAARAARRRARTGRGQAHASARSTRRRRSAPRRRALRRRKALILRTLSGDTHGALPAAHHHRGRGRRHVREARRGRWTARKPWSGKMACATDQLKAL